MTDIIEHLESLRAMERETADAQRRELLQQQFSQDYVDERREPWQGKVAVTRGLNPKNAEAFSDGGTEYQPWRFADKMPFEGIAGQTVQLPSTFTKKYNLDLEISPTSDDGIAIAESAQMAVAQMEWAAKYNIPLAMGTSTDPMAMTGAAEIAGATQSDFMASLVAEQLYGSSFGRADLEDYADPFVLEALAYADTKLSDIAVQGLLESLAALQGGSRKSFMANVSAYLDMAFDPNSAEADINFQLWQFQKAVQYQQDDFSKASFIGEVGEFVSQPYRGVSNLTSQIFANAGSPQDAWYRQELSPGQNLAISTGAIPGTSRWEYQTGVTDGVYNILGDPITYVGTVATGWKAAKITPLIASKPKAFAQSLIPFMGRRLIGTRSITGRITHVIKGKTVDEMLEAPNMVKASEWIARETSVAKIINRIPEWKHATGMVDALARETDPKGVRRIIRDGFMGAYDTDSHTYLNLREARDRTSTVLRNRLKTIPNRRAVRARGPIIDEATGARGEILEMDEAIAIDVLGDPETGSQGAAARILDNIDDFQIVDNTTVTLKDGSEASLTAGYKNPELSEPGPFTIIHRDGEVLGARIDQRSATAEGARGNRVYSTILEYQRDNMGLTPDDFTRPDGDAVSGGAAAAVNKVFGLYDGDYLQHVDGLEGYSSVRGVWKEEDGRLVKTEYMDTGEERIIFQNNAKFIELDDDVMQAVRSFAEETGIEDAEEAVRKYGEAEGAAAIGAEGRVILLDDTAILRGIDGSGGKLSDDIAGLVEERHKAHRAFNSFAKTRYSDMWIIKDMPTGRFNPDVDEWISLRPFKYGGASNNKNWWVRAAKARAFGRYPPSSISVTSKSQGYQQLQTLLTYWGVKADDVAKFVDRYLGATDGDRFGEVLQILQEAAEDIKHPLIRFQLQKFFRNEGVHGFGAMMDGEEVLMTASRTMDGKMSARPFIPSMRADSVPLPDPVETMKALKRYKWGRNAGPAWTRGFLPGTKEKRAQIAKTLRLRLPKELRNKVTDEEMMAIAYSVVDGKSMGLAGNSGLGAISHLGNFVGAGWRIGVKTFSVAQLAFRPMPWFGRVSLDENFRATTTQLPTMMRNPKNYMSRFMDQWVLSRANKYRERNLDWAHDTAAQFRKFKDPKKMYQEAKKVIPNLEELIDVEDLRDAASLRVRLARILNEAAVTNDWGEIINGVPRYRQRAYGRAIRVADDLGFQIRRKGGFDWEEDVPEIWNQGSAYFASLQTSTVPVHFKSGGKLTPDAIEEAGVSWQNSLQTFMHDPLIGIALQRMQDGYLGSKGSRSYKMTKALDSEGYRAIEPYIEQWAAENGIQGGRREMLDAYIDQRILPFTRAHMDPFMAQFDLASEKAAALEDLMASKRLQVGEFSFDFRKNSDGRADLTAFLTKLDDDGVDIPPLYKHMDPHTMMDEPTGLWGNMKKWPSKVIDVFGNQLSQATMRREAYIETALRESKYRMRLGVPEEAAKAMGRQKAAEITNNIFYNSEQVTPFNKNMNNIVPFYTAFIEIMQTWGWKLPMAQGGFGVGHLNIIRKVDRVTDALRELGLIYYDEHGTPTLALDLDADSGVGRGAGDALSKAGATLINSPLTLASHILNMGHAMTSSLPEELQVGEADPRRFEFAVSSPIDIGNYGIGSALDANLSLQPGLSLAASALRERIPAVAGNTTIVGTGNLIDLAAENEIDPARLLGYNLDRIVDAVGVETYTAYQRGDIDLEDINLEGVELVVPNTSLWGTLVKDIFFPFGEINSPSEMLEQFQPTWVKYAARAMAMWPNNNPQQAIDSGFLFWPATDYTRSMSSSAIMGSFRHIEATEGQLEKLDEYTNRFYEMAAPYLDVNKVRIGKAGLEWVGEQPADAEDVNAAYELMNDFEENLWARSIELGASEMWLRGFLAFFMPGTPRLHYAEERTMDSYYASLGTLPDGRRNLYGTDYEDIMEYIRLRADDPSGTSATARFVAAHPELKPYLVGTTYWEPGGQPPLNRTIDEYFDDLEAGLTSVKPYDVFSYQMRTRDIESERQLEFREKYGHDPVRAASASLADPLGYEEFMEPFNMHRSMQEFEDELAGNPYKEWKERNREDKFDIIAEQERNYFEFEQSLSEVLDIVEANPNMDITEVKSIADEIQGLKSGISEIRREFEESDDDLSWMNPTQRYRLAWFEDVYVPYLDEVGEQYGRLDEAMSDTEQDVIWNRIAAIKDSWNRQILIDGVEFPNPVEYQLEKKPPALREAARVKSITFKPEWLSEQQVDEILSTSPQLEKFLPTTPLQRSVYDEYNAEIEEIEAEYANGTGDIPFQIYEAKIDNAKVRHRVNLLQSGMMDQLQWTEMWPIQKLALAEQLPPVITNTGLLEKINAAQRMRSMEGYKSIGEGHPARQAIQRMVWEALDYDPAFREAIIEIGLQVYGEGVPDGFIDRLLFNDYFN